MLKLEQYCTGRHRMQNSEPGDKLQNYWKTAQAVGEQ